MADRRVRVADRRYRGWYYVDNVVLDEYAPQIGPGAGMVYNALCRIAGHGAACWARESHIGQLAGGISARSVRDKIVILELVQLITVTEYFGPDGQDGHLYLLLTPDPAGPPPDWQRSDRPQRDRITTTDDPQTVLARLDTPPEKFSGHPGNDRRPPRQQSPAPPEADAGVKSRRKKNFEEVEDTRSPAQEDLDSARRKLHALDTQGYLAPGQDLTPAEVAAAESTDHLRRQLKKLRRRGIDLPAPEKTQP